MISNKISAPPTGVSSSLKVFDMQTADVASSIEILTRSGLESWKYQDFQTEIERADSLILVAKLGETVVGFCIARLITNYYYSATDNVKTKIGESNRIKFNDVKYNNVEFRFECEIYNLAIDEKHRRRGYAGVLLDELIRRLPGANAGLVRLEVRKSNETAIRFYRKNDFRAIYERKNFYAHPSENGIVMEKKLALGRRFKRLSR